jgi:hypothetical protein
MFSADRICKNKERIFDILICVLTDSTAVQSELHKYPIIYIRSVNMIHILDLI